MDRPLALVTGASSGIGAAFARLLAARGWDLALTARREDRLEALGAELAGRFGVQAVAIPDDLSDPAAPARIMQALSLRGLRCGALVNNAGFGLTGAYARTRWEDQSAFIQLMTASPCQLAHRLLPQMLDDGFGRIVNVASLAGMIPGTAGHTLYAASKAFLIKFSQSLHLEARGTGVHVTALCPGFTWSEFHDVNGTRMLMDAALPQWMWMSAEAVAAAGWRAVEANRPVCVPGVANKAAAALAALVPGGVAMRLAAIGGRRFRRLDP